MEWLNYINYYIDTGYDSLSLSDFIDQNSDLVKFIGMSFTDYTINDEDFCLFRSFPSTNA